jgi:mono/diheme cytochrome c family protein
MRKRITICVVSLLAGLTAAQEGDRPGEPQAALPAHWNIPPAPVLPPEDALKTFQLADDFLTIELFASEPMVQDPVAMDFDADGRLWVVEMRGFMPDIDGRGEHEPVGRVSILEDTDGDGRADKATVFLDKLILPRAIKVCWGGALVAHDEKLWFAKDTNGDDVADVRELVDADYIQSGNPEHQPNGLLLALDNWIYSAKSDQRYRRVGGKWLKEKTEFRGQWGITQDDFGRLYYNVNYSQLHVDLFPPNYSLRNPNFIPVHAINQRIATDQRIFTLRPNTGVNRAYRPGILDERGHLKEFTSACAPHVYRDTKLWSGDDFGPHIEVFVCEPAANLIKRNRVMPGVFGVASEFAYPDREFLASTDERFRPVWLATSPDGSLFIADMYRGINQHKQYMTSHLRGETLARGLDKGIHYGRIWRVRHRHKPLWKVAALSDAPPETLLRELRHPNGTVRDLAQRLLVESDDETLIPKLVNEAARPGWVLGQVQALWAMEGLLAELNEQGGGAYHLQCDRDTWRKLLALVSDDVRVGENALRVAGLIARGNAERETELIARIAEVASRRRPWNQVTGALVAGDLQHEKSLPLLLDALQEFYFEPLVREAVFSARPGREWTILKLLLESVEWDRFTDGRDLALQGLAALVVKQRDPEQVGELLRLVGMQTGERAWRQLPLLNGVLENRLALRRNPIQLPAEPVALLNLRQSEDPIIRSAAETIATFLEWPGHRVERPPVVRLRPLTGAFAQQFAEGRALYQQACAACHGLAGEGLPNLAPPLVDSEWVTGPTDRLIRIVLHGMEGPIEVNGRTYEPPEILPNMPAVDSLTDTEIAALLGYVTREMGMIGRPVSAQDVAVIRNRFADRSTPWTAAELNGAP